MSSSSNLTTTDSPHWNTSQHHGPAVSVITWLLIIAVVFAVAARTATRYAIIHTLRWDDITALLATLSAIGQSIAVSIEAANGLGSHQDSLSKVKFSRFQKSDYASSLVYVTTLGLIKVSTCFHIYGLTPVKAQRQASIGVGCFCALWALTSLIVVAFECKLPRVWGSTRGDECLNFVAFWTYFGILNIITDIALVALPIPIILKLQVSAGKKAVVLGCYATRFFVIAAVIVQLYFLHSNTVGSKDLSYNLWIPVLCAQAVVSFSIISACFPFLKFLVDALETGLVRAADGRDRRTQKYGSSTGEGGAYYKARGSQYKTGPSYGHGSRAFGSSKDASMRVQHSDVLRMNNLDKRGSNPGTGIGGNRGPINQLQTTATKGSRTDDDVDSQSSQTHIIRKVEWTLTEENAGVSRV